ncbi:hypothetical protein Sps_04705 [Shewanella psychrophila]|uniref:Uncharacterized protein n=1 Tax=Shewanella psychrophila TaxID=225848 RepID=A0A1S6HWJ6_9GAMM|nr:hypothetical protein [Shewanella psychrophila]AQS39788.1 hypothetical protein Sps_04705 [Shewanella psychrophila]
MFAFQRNKERENVVSSQEQVETYGNRTVAAPLPSLKGGGRKRPGLKVVIGPQNKIPTSTVGLSLDTDKITTTGAGAEFFHGSRSSSLLAFSDSAGDFKGQILPMGTLMSEGLYPFSGEAGNSLAANAANTTAVSVVRAENVGAAYDYATQELRAPRFDLARSETEVATAEKELVEKDGVSADVVEKLRLGTDDGFSFSDFATTMKARRLILNSGRLRRWSGLSTVERDFVSEDFPLLYGFTEKNNDLVVPIHSDIPGEFGITGGVKSDGVKVIYTEEAQVQRVLNYLHAKGFNSIAVRSFKDILYVPATRV